MERKLAAILAADVVGYSALMERDEKGTFERLQKVRKEVFEPEIERFGGHVFKLMGDGLLAEFESVVGAVECAVALQQSIAERNRDMATKERLDFRIGINIGDDIVEGSDRYGEGVNIAARLQQLAEPGGICLSRTVIDHLGNKLPIAIEAMGEHRLKNIARPIEVYRVRLRDGDAAKPTTKPVRTIAGSSRMAAASAILLVAVGGLAWLGPWGKAPEPTSAASSVVVGAEPSLVVLPFQSLSDDKNQAYLAEGITDDLTTALARIPGLFVISHNSALPYRIKVEPTLIAEELGISYILEGSIRRGGDDATRINAQLIHAPTGRHIWAERFDGAWGDIFGLQDQVVSSVASALALRLVGGSRIAEVPGGTRNATAYNYYLQGYELNYADSPAKAAEAYRQAVALDPGFGLAWAELAWVYWSAAGDNAAQAALGAGSEEAEKRPSSTFYQLIGCSAFLSAIIRRRDISR
ncbi:adenylate/guanylate cyclase domain-containing protein [Rhizobiaceae bacterium n13]|uniref:Adenylate/guanylate cyclase domain-containing protein n=1 Tax=Ferirhizobium litorale TaxID=2927786 RepID=A0AAE3QAZ8_9HYPH|nr:adenylate/guanylate cyclase domain-containing protein [Fererhizobium litorale]MDI7862269.1 adenylate/guanylate cyclase domain-containing protein [Fererhizobium litorale]MDI7922457.1 adenylate/guanylate cyclase domain-containing protein [Fererhizobium litorale]